MSCLTVDCWNLVDLLIDLLVDLQTRGHMYLGHLGWSAGGQRSGGQHNLFNVDAH